MTKFVTAYDPKPNIRFSLILLNSLWYCDTWPKAVDAESSRKIIVVLMIDLLYGTLSKLGQFIC
jgi:hypothetical protein